MKVIYNSDRIVEGVIRKGGEIVEVSDRAGHEHIEEGIARAADTPPKAILYKKQKGGNE